MNFEDAVVRRKERLVVGSMDRVRSGARMQRTRSATSVAGEMLAGSSTAVSKDWDCARDLQSRGQLLQAHRTRRRTSKDEAHYAGTTAEGPFVRGPRFEPLEGTPESLSWHEQRVTSIFAKLDIKKLGQVNIDRLQESFELLQVPIDEDMFARYARELLPLGATAVTLAQFIGFHKAVWSNQPAAVRHRAGCPRAFVGCAAADVEVCAADLVRPDSPGTLGSSVNAVAMLRSVASSPSLMGLQDVKESEAQLRRAYRKNASSSSGCLEYQNLPAVFKDLGLDCKALPEVESEARELYNVADADSNGVLSFHEFVEFQNRYVASLETLRDGGFTDAFRLSPSC